MHSKIKLEESASPFISAKRKSSQDSRLLQKRYRSIELDIAESKHELGKRDSKFNAVFSNLQQLHEKVDKPREQLADAGALFSITSTFLETVKGSKRAQEPSPSEFVSSTIRKYGQSSCMNMKLGHETAVEPVMDWESLGCVAKSIFSDVPGMATMIGPMDKETKVRKAYQRRQRTQPSQTVMPEKLENNDTESTDATKNAFEMFEVVKRLRSVPLDALVLNRKSFAQTVENVFALSYLVKDGRVEISIKDGRCLVLGPRNFPTQQRRDQGPVPMHQFVFRFDFKDWQTMLRMVEPGTELMPHRCHNINSETPRVLNEVKIISSNRAQETEQRDSHFEDQAHIEVCLFD